MEKGKYESLLGNLVSARLIEPKVSFGTELGQKIGRRGVIGYDSVQLGALLDKLDIPPDYRQELEICVVGANDLDTEGYYDGYAKKVVVALDSTGEMDEILKYELSHFKDHVVDKQPIEPSKLYKAGVTADTARDGASIATLTTISLITLNSYMGNPIPPVVLEMARNSGASAVAVLLAVSSLYLFHPREVRARRAQDIEHPAIFSYDQQQPKRQRRLLAKSSQGE